MGLKIDFGQLMFFFLFISLIPLAAIIILQQLYPFSTIPKDQMFRLKFLRDSNHIEKKFKDKVLLIKFYKSALLILFGCWAFAVISFVINLATK